MNPRERIFDVLREFGPQTGEEIVGVITRKTEQAHRAALLQLIKAGRLRPIPGGQLEAVKITGGEDP